MAERLKREGRTLNELIARKTIQLHGAGANFNTLPPQAQNAVYASIVRSAGQANQRVTEQMRFLSRAGRGPLVLSIAVSAYTVATADDKAASAGEEAPSPVRVSSEALRAVQRRASSVGREHQSA